MARVPYTSDFLTVHTNVRRCNLLCGAVYFQKIFGRFAGVVGAGGNVGAVSAGFLFKGDLTWDQAYLILGALVTIASFLALFIRFTKEDEIEAEERFDKGFTESRREAARKHLRALGIDEDQIDNMRVYGSKEAHALKRLEGLGVDLSDVKMWKD